MGYCPIVCVVGFVCVCERESVCECVCGIVPVLKRRMLQVMGMVSHSYADQRVCFNHQGFFLSTLLEVSLYVILITKVSLF